ncbi:siphovirus Gp157 family protein [Peptoniphilus grossensis]|uniref:siphovirus Gp157 family protein n=1 Tax=Peptoniphilus grossensis TaxID=1465756 RepID=UPI0002DA91BA|nr:siphovirus Gp157 family protein [Peptoniphilus grossensis]
MENFTLYELTELYTNLLDLDLEDEQVQEALEDIDEKIEVKADNIAKLIKGLEGQKDICKAEEERIYKRRKSIENRIENLKEYLKATMIATDKRKFKTDLFSFNIQKNRASIKILDEEKVPEEYVEYDRKVLKDKLKKAITEGLEADYAEMIQSESIRIR